MLYRDSCSGFTLIEVAIVLLVVALLVGGLLGPLSIRVEQEERRKTQLIIDEIKEALYGYTATTGALPCPDTDVPGDGVPDVTATTPPACIQIEGRLPWQTLGVERADVWGNQFRYRVTAEFSVANTGSCDDDNNENPARPPGFPTNPDGSFDLCDVGGITVSTRDNVKQPIALVTDAPAVIVSHGKNGLGARRIDGGVIPGLIAGSDEEVNADPPGNSFFSRGYSFPNTNCSDTNPAQDYCAYDDIVVWISPNVLKNRMIAAGRLP